MGGKRKKKKETPEVYLRNKLKKDSKNGENKKEKKKEGKKKKRLEKARQSEAKFVNKKRNREKEKAETMRRLVTSFTTLHFPFFSFHSLSSLSPKFSLFLHHFSVASFFLHPNLIPSDSFLLLFPQSLILLHHSQLGTAVFLAVGGLSFHLSGRQSL